MASTPTNRRPATPLKLAIIADGRDQKDIAAEIGVHPSHLSRIVSGLHCDEHTRRKIAMALGRKISEIWPDSERRAA